MSEKKDEQAVTVDIENFVARVEIHRPPNNWFDMPVIIALAEAVLGLDDEPSCRAIVLCSEGKNFCAGADFRRHLAGVLVGRAVEEALGGP